MRVNMAVNRQGRIAEMLRFLLIGLLNTGFSYGTYSLLLAMGLDFASASFLALCAGIVWSFATQGRLVFRQHLRGRFFRYLLVWASLYVLNVSIIAGLIRLDLGPYLAGFIALFPVTGLSYILQRRFVFRSTS